MKARLPFIWLRYWHSCEDSSGPQSVKSSLISSLVFCRVYGLGKATTAVTAATRITSRTGYLPEGKPKARRHTLARSDSLVMRSSASYALSILKARPDFGDRQNTGDWIARFAN